MEIKRILFPVDFSDSTAFALKYVSSLAKEYDAELHIVYAYEEPLAFSDVEIAGYVAPADLEPDRARLEEIVPTSEDVRFRREFLMGPPSIVLLEYAEENAIDLIVMGTHGRTGLSRLLMGSVAEAVVRKAKCPVMTIKPPSATLVGSAETEDGVSESG